MIKLKAIIIGFLAGFVGGLTGLGGGIVVVPAMVFIFKKSQHISQGTALITIFFAALLNTLIYGFHNYVDFELFIMLSIGSITGVYFGATLVQNIPDRKLRKYYGIFLLIVSIKMIF